MIESKDQLGDLIHLHDVPQRVVSIVPSQTELLFDLGLGDRVVGITKFCIHPDNWFRNKTRVGGTKTVNIDKVRELRPDLIIANKEENTKEDIEALREIAPVWISDIITLEDSLAMITSLGKLLNTESKAKEIIETIKSGFANLPQLNASVAYAIWKDPFMWAGEGTFIDDILGRLGLQNAIKTERYPALDRETINADYIFLSSEPYPFKEEHVRDLQKLHPQSKVVIVDGEYFSWYGSRLQNAPKYFKQLLSELTPL